MANGSIRIRLVGGQRELELEGPKPEVIELLERFASLVALIEGPSRVNPQAPPQLPAPLSSGAREAESAAEIGTTFGEYFHMFRDDITDLDRALIAGSFAQSSSPDRVFSTRDVNMLLQDQGVRLSNPSVAIRRNVDARRAFVVNRGQFRVARVGHQHLETLRISDQPE